MYNIKTAKSSDLVKKGDYDTNIGEIEKRRPDHDHGEYITIQEFNKLTAENFAERSKQSNLKWYCWFRIKNRFWWKAKTLQ